MRNDLLRIASESRHLAWYRVSINGILLKSGRLEALQDSFTSFDVISREVQSPPFHLAISPSFPDLKIALSQIQQLPLGFLYV
jgi:hypothetical protein